MGFIKRIIGVFIFLVGLFLVTGAFVHRHDKIMPSTPYVFGFFGVIFMIGGVRFGREKPTCQQEESAYIRRQIPKAWEQEMPTQKQLDFIEYLGGDPSTVKSKAEASLYIESLKSEDE